MSVKHIRLSLNDPKHFELSIGKRILKKDLENKHGTMPVYSANIKTPFGYYSKSCIKNFDDDFILWGIDGDCEFNFIKKNNPFCPTDHCGVIRILNDNILPEYLMLSLQQSKVQHKFDRNLRPSLTRMKSVEVSLPVKNDETLSIERQKAVIKKYQIVKDLELEIDGYIKQINNLDVIDGSDQYRYDDVYFDTIFDIITGNAMFTKSYIKNHKGNYPVYSSYTKGEGVFGRIDHFNHNFECIQVAVHSGTVFHRLQHKFSINADAKLLVKKSDLLDYSYLALEVKKAFEKHNFNWNNKVSKNRLSKIKLQIPVNEKNKWSISAQKSIAKKHTQINNIKSELLSNLEKAKNQKLNYNIM